MYRTLNIIIMDNIRKGAQILALLFLISYSVVSTKTMEKQGEQIKGLIQKSLVVDSVNAKLLLKMDTIMKIHPWHKPRDRRWSSCPGNFLGFVVYGRVDTRIDSTLIQALVAYNGPKTIITSLRRHWGTKSDHEHGKAVDFDLSDDLVDFLVSEGGQKWLKDHGLKMYIEGRKGCSEVSKYALRDECKPFIFFNPRATGPHIHVEIA